MTGDVSHPVVHLVLGELPLRDLSAFAVAEREDVVAVVVQNYDTRHVVLVERRENEWAVPTMISGGRSPADAPRPAKTDGPEALHDRAITQSGWPGADGGPPEVAWCAVTGVAAQDACDVLISSEIDEFIAPIRDDGFVLAVVRVRWRERPSITVRTSEGRRVTDQRP